MPDMRDAIAHYLAYRGGPMPGGGRNRRRRRRSMITYRRRPTGPGRANPGGVVLPPQEPGCRTGRADAAAGVARCCRRGRAGRWVRRGPLPGRRRLISPWAVPSSWRTAAADGLGISAFGHA